MQQMPMRTRLPRLSVIASDCDCGQYGERMGGGGGRTEWFVVGSVYVCL
jgi:hypothetical protein